MCGISGYIGDFPTDLISHMNRSISHRGPDHSGVERFDFGAVGHVRLSIIDLTSASNQPFISVIVGDILLYIMEKYIIFGSATKVRAERRVFSIFRRCRGFTQTMG